MDQKDVEKIVQYLEKDLEKIVQWLENIEPDVDWLKIEFHISKTRGEIIFLRDNENEFNWVQTKLQPNYLQ